MIFHENRHLADDFHEISYLIFSKIRKDDEKFVVCCSRDRVKKTKIGEDDLALVRVVHA